MVNDVKELEVNNNTPKITLAIKAYFLFSKINGHLYRHLINKRRAKGKEHATRYIERFGIYSTQRPAGKLIWFNAVSVGEALALRPLIDQLIATDKSLHILVTTVTVTSAEVLEKTLPKRATHLFSPVDTESATRKFLEHWKPNLAIWCESEIWPRIIHETSAAGIPMLLINARISDNTAKKWLKMKASVCWILSQFDKIFVQIEQLEKLLIEIGVHRNRICISGTTKEDLNGLPYDANELTDLQDLAGGRHIWIAASTHPGEEEIAMQAHLAVREKHSPTSLLIIAPRHPERSEKIIGLARKLNLNLAVRSNRDTIAESTDVYIANTIGEMGLWYALAKTAFIGGSLANIGGHNPYEPIASHTAVITGPNTYNFSEVYESLHKCKGCALVYDEMSLAKAVITLSDDTTRSAMVEHAQASVQDTNSAAKLVVDHIKTTLGI